MRDFRRQSSDFLTDSQLIFCWKNRGYIPDINFSGLFPPSAGLGQFIKACHFEQVSFRILSHREGLRITPSDSAPKLLFQREPVMFLAQTAGSFYQPQDPPRFQVQWRK
jgi:hypothetical protein